MDTTTVANGSISALEGVSQLTIASVLIPAVLTFLIGVFLAPVLIRILVKNRLWRKQTVNSPIVAALAVEQDNELRTPRMGGLVVMVAAVLTLVVFWLLPQFSDNGFLASLNIISRSQTYLPIFALVVGFIIGLVDDLIVVEKLNLPRRLRGYLGGGLPLSLRLFAVVVIGLVCGWWFYSKLGATTVAVPFVESDLSLGWLMVPAITLVMVGTYSGTTIDGIDGLAGGVFSTVFLTYTAIALFQGLFDLAALCLVIVGGLFAFLWYNIPPARFYLSETGALGLALALSLVAFLTDTIFLLPLIAAPLVWTPVSGLIQVFFRRFRGRRFFLVAPIHNHFRATGSAPAQVVMRYWVISQVFALTALAIFLIGY